MKEKIIEIIRNACALEEKEITPQTEFSDLSLDSLSFIEVIVNIEREYEIEFNDEKLNIYDWKTVEDLSHYVEERRNGI